MSSKKGEEGVKKVGELEELLAQEVEILEEFIRKTFHIIAAPVWHRWHGHLATGSLAMGNLATKGSWQQAHGNGQLGKTGTLLKTRRVLLIRQLAGH
jgi:hypothetical protein